MRSDTLGNDVKFVEFIDERISEIESGSEGESLRAFGFMSGMLADAAENASQNQVLSMIEPLRASYVLKPVFDSVSLADERKILIRLRDAFREATEKVLKEHEHLIDDELKKSRKA
jgi:hypothetical protein